MSTPVSAGPDAAGKICPACNTAIPAGAAIVACLACGTPHHHTCWQRRGKCAAPGCAAQPAPTTMQPKAPPPAACPKCGYVFGPLETTCRRCAAGMSPLERPVLTPTQPRRSAVWPIVAGLLVVLAIGAGVIYSTSKPGAITLEYKFRPGQEEKYNMTMDMTINAPQVPGPGPKSMDMKLTALYVQKVLSVNSDGSARIENTMRNAKMTSSMLPMLNGQTLPDQTSTMTINAKGKNAKTGTGGLFSQMGMMQKDFGGSNPFGGGQLLPDHPVNVGDTWTETIPMDGGEMKIASKLVSADEMVGSRKTCRIEQDYNAEMDLGKAAKGSGNSLSMGGTMTMTGHGVFHFSQEEGQDVDANMKFSANIKAGGGEMTMGFNIALAAIR